MSTHLDIIGSVIIAGMIILNFTVFMGERQESQIESTNKITAQTEMTDITETLRHDLRKVGYGCDSAAILRAEPTLLVFRADLDNNGSIDTVAYAFVEDKASTTSTSTSTTTTTTTTSVTTSEESGTTYYVNDEGNIIEETKVLTPPKYLLYRVVNSRKVPGYDVGLQGMTFKYYESNKYGQLTETTSLAAINAIAVTLRLRSKMQEDGKYQYTVNEFTVTPKNL
ncbi:hypothetical protein KQI65_05495 [bacterium]|nr:hypothetical protein [bacterium]